MSTTEERLLVLIEASTRQAENNIKRLEKVSRTSMTGIERSASRGSAGMRSLSDGMRIAARNSSASLTQLSFQLNDIATGLLTGQSPFTILAQQGGQLVQVWQLNRNILSDIGGLISRWALRLAPLVGVVASLYGAFRLLQSFSAAAALSVNDATRALADNAESYAGVKGAVSELESLQKKYQQAIAKTADVQNDASQRIIASTEREFNAKKSLLALELKRQQALIKTQQADLALQQHELRKEIGQQVLTNPDLYGSGFADRRVGRLVQLPDSVTGLEKTFSVIENSPLQDKITELRANMELTELAAEQLQTALEMTFDGGTPVSSKESTKAADKIKRVVDALRHQEAQIGRTAREQAIYNQLRAAGTTLDTDAGQTIAALAGLMYDLEQAQAANVAAMNAFRDASQDAMSSFIGNLREGMDLAEAFDGVLNRLTAAISNAQIDRIMNGLMGAQGTSGTGIFGTLARLLFGGARANGGPVSSGRAYLVGERGPEIMVPRTAGTVIPNGAGGGGSIIQVIDQRSSDAPPVETERSRGPDGAEMVRLIVRDEMASAETAHFLGQRFGAKQQLIQRG